MIDYASEAVAHQEDGGPRSILHHEQHRELGQDHERHHPFEVGVVAEQPLDLRVLLWKRAAVSLSAFAPEAILT